MNIFLCLLNLQEKQKILQLSSVVTFKIILDADCFSYCGHCHYLEITEKSHKKVKKVQKVFMSMYIRNKSYLTPKVAIHKKESQARGQIFILAHQVTLML